MAHLLTRKRCAVGAEFRRRSIGAALVRFGNQSVFVLQPHVLVKGSRNQCGFLFFFVFSVLYPSSPAGPLYHVEANSMVHVMVFQFGLCRVSGGAGTVMVFPSSLGRAAYAATREGWEGTGYPSSPSSNACRSHPRAPFLVWSPRPVIR